MTVFILLAVLVKEPAFGPKVVDLQYMVFKDAARCLRNAESNRKRLQNQYDQVNITCAERKVEQ